MCPGERRTYERIRLPAPAQLASITCLGLVLCCVLLEDRLAHAQSFWEGFVDPMDGHFDVSNWLLKQKGFFPVPMFVTEPAVGFGAGGALLFFHEAKTAAEPNETSASQGDANPHGVAAAPPSISAAFGLGTENGTWAAGGLHFGSWKQDRIRYW